VRGAGRPTAAYGMYAVEDLESESVKPPLAAPAPVRECPAS
jgi:hypothetical protein